MLHAYCDMGHRFIGLNRRSFLVLQSLSQVRDIEGLILTLILSCSDQVEYEADLQNHIFVFLFLGIALHSGVMPRVYALVLL